MATKSRRSTTAAKKKKGGTSRASRTTTSSTAVKKGARRRRRTGTTSLRLKDLPKELLGAAKTYGIPFAVSLFAASAGVYAFNAVRGKDGVARVSWKSYAASAAVPIAIGFLLKKYFKKKDVAFATISALGMVAAWSSIGSGLKSNKVLGSVVGFGRKAASLMNADEKARLAAEAKGGSSAASMASASVMAEPAFAPSTTQSGVAGLPQMRQARNMHASGRRGVSGDPRLANNAMRARTILRAA